ncbi:MAG: hypothetical protein Q9225_006484 [Loekoesia sp. 1 TL-2023]
MYHPRGRGRGGPYGYSNQAVQQAAPRNKPAQQQEFPQQGPKLRNAPLQNDPVPDDFQRWPREKTVSGRCKSPLDDLEPTAAKEIAQIYYKGDETEIWGIPVDTSRLSHVEMKQIDTDLAEQEKRLNEDEKKNIKITLARKRDHLIQEKLVEKVWEESCRRNGRDLFNSVWYYHENPFWLEGTPEMARDPFWESGTKIGKALEGSLIRIPYRSDIPKIPEIPQDDNSQQTAWIYLIKRSYPSLSRDDITAVFNRIWYGPQIIYHMTARVRIEWPVNPKQLSADEVGRLFNNQQLWDKADEAQWMQKLRASTIFACTFPNPRFPGQPYRWFTNFQCVEKKIKNAAERTRVKLEGH